MIFFTGATIAFFLFAILTAKKKKNQSNWVLWVWLFVIGLHLTLYYFNYNGIDLEYPFLLGIMLPLPVAQGPLLFLYVTSLTKGLAIVEKKNAKNLFMIVVHVLPVLTLYLFLIPFFLMPSTDKLSYFKYVAKNPNLYSIIQFYLTFFSGIFYIFWSFLLLKKHKKIVKQNFSYKQQVNLNWLNYLIYGMAVIWLSVLCVEFFMEGLLTNAQQSNVTFTTVSLFTLLLGYFGIRQTTIFLPSELSTQHMQKDIRSVHFRNQYEKSGLRNDVAKEIKSTLLLLFESQEVYRDAELSLSHLSNITQISPNHLSQVLNEHFKMSFYDFVNGYRLNEFIERIEEVKLKKTTILTLALECGFNSKSSFNTIFKRKTGITPSEYINNKKPISLKK